MAYRSRHSDSAIAETIKALMDKGTHPRIIRKTLSELGARWAYQYSGQGQGEKARRLRQRYKAGLCACCDERRQGSSELCESHLRQAAAAEGIAL